MKNRNRNIILLAVPVMILGMTVLSGCDDSDEKAEGITKEQTAAIQDVPVIEVQPLDDSISLNIEATDNVTVQDETDTALESDLREAETDVTSETAPEAATDNEQGTDTATEGADTTTEANTTEADASEETAVLETADNAATVNAAGLVSGAPVGLNPDWTYANFSKINTGTAVYYAATANAKGIAVGVNAGHGTKGGGSVKTYCHPDMTPKVTGGSTAAGSIEASAVSGGMAFNNGEGEASVNLRLAQFLKAELLSRGYDVLMIRDGEDVQLDNVARTVLCNNMANCHMAIHFDGDGTSSDKGCFYCSVPDALKAMVPVANTWSLSEALGDQIMSALSAHGHKLYNGGSTDIDLTQTSYSTVPSVDVEYGNQCSDTSDANLADLAAATADGVDYFFQMINH